MSFQARIATAATVALALTATLYVYWTRTPQYTLLHALHVHGDGDRERLATLLEPEQPKSIMSVAASPAERATRYVALAGNHVLKKTYHINVTNMCIEGRRAVLRVEIAGTEYDLTFVEQRHGEWKLLPFDGWTRMAKQAVEQRNDQALWITARL